MVRVSVREWGFILEFVHVVEKEWKQTPLSSVDKFGFAVNPSKV